YAYAVVVDYGCDRGSRETNGVYNIQLDMDRPEVGNSWTSCTCPSRSTCRHITAANAELTRVLDRTATGDFVTAVSGALQENPPAPTGDRPEFLIDRFLITATRPRLVSVLRGLIADGAESETVFDAVHRAALEDLGSPADDLVGLRREIDATCGRARLLEGEELEDAAERVRHATSTAERLLPDQAGDVALELRRFLDILRLRLLNADDEHGLLADAVSGVEYLYRCVCMLTCTSPENRRELGQWIVDYTRRDVATEPVIDVLDYKEVLGEVGLASLDEALAAWERELAADPIARKFEDAVDEVTEQFHYEAEQSSYDEWGFGSDDEGTWQPTAWDERASAQGRAARLRSEADQCRWNVKDNR
uniref:hypothetical protein n=1 Tax=uncultured Corynebacterium sp. TaxID=159447 RepID=UPI0025EFDF2A